METANIIFKNDNIEIFWNETLSHGTNKAVRATVKAVNPNDGKTYEKYAGWVSSTLALHGGANTPSYVYEAGSILIEKHRDEIIASIVSFLNSKGELNRAKNFTEHNGMNAGNGVTIKTSHPLGEKQRYAVKKQMQKNAPIGTNHM